MKITGGEKPSAISQAEVERDMALAELRAARNEVSCCDDVPLDRGLAFAIAMLRSQRDYYRAEVIAVRDILDPERMRLTAEQAAHAARSTHQYLVDEVGKLQRLRDASAEQVEGLKELGPVLSECRWFLMDMHILPPETTCAMSTDLLTKVDAAICKAHAVLGHSPTQQSAGEQG